MPHRVYNLFFHPGEVVEIRAIGGMHGRNKAWEGGCFGQKGSVSGYFNNAKDFDRCARALDDAGAHGVYFTLNPVMPELMARASNRLKANLNNTQDKEIICYRWLPIDLDPVRPSGISSSEEELAAAKELAGRIAKWVESELGFPPGIRAKSGNGYHLLYRLQEIPPNEGNKTKIKDALAAIKAHFEDETRVDIDQSVFNPARIFKVYGTMARKGDSVPERPHRRSALYDGQPTTLSEVPIVEKDKD